MTELAAVTAALAFVVWLALTRQRLCGARDEARARTCMRLSLSKCYEHRVYAQAPVRAFERRWWVDWDTHTWLGDEHLDRHYRRMA